MEENKNLKYPLKYYFAEIASMLLGTIGICFLGNEAGWTYKELMAKAILTILGLAVVGFQFRRAYFQRELELDNECCPYRYWILLAICICLALGCVYLPVSGWPFVPVFVLLTLFSNAATGVLSATILLLLAVMIGDMNVFCLGVYLVSGLFAVALFHKPDKAFRIGIPLFLSSLCLVMVLTMYEVLLAGDEHRMDYFFILLTNVIISAIVLVLGMCFYMKRFVFQEENQYAQINNADNPYLVKFKEEQKEKYLQAVHIAHFCECIGKALELDVDAMKCVAYYHGMGDGLKEATEEYVFPHGAVEILQEYAGSRNHPKRKETAVVLCADTVLSGMEILLKRASDKDVDCEKAVDAIFRKLWENGYFDECALSVAEIRTMQRLFKEEKIYYEFLCRN